MPCVRRSAPLGQSPPKSREGSLVWIRQVQVANVSKIRLMNDDFSSAQRFAAKQLFHDAYEAQQAQDFDRAIELYKRSMVNYPTADFRAFLVLVFFFQGVDEEAMED